MESTLILPRVTEAAENLEFRREGKGSNPAPSSGESIANLTSFDQAAESFTPSPIQRSATALVLENSGSGSPPFLMAVERFHRRVDIKNPRFAQQRPNAIVECSCSQDR